LNHDITAWSLPYAYGLNAIASESHVATREKNNSYFLNTQKNSSEINEETYAYVTDWNSMNDARFLADILKAKIRVRYAQRPFKTETKSIKKH